MGIRAELEDLLGQLEKLMGGLAAADPEKLQQQAARLAPCGEALARLLEALRQGHQPGSEAAEVARLLEEARRRMATIRAMLEHERLVRFAVTGILGQLDSPQNGSRYTARGLASCPSPQRLIEEA